MQLETARRDATLARKQSYGGDHYASPLTSLKSIVMSAKSVKERSLGDFKWQLEKSGHGKIILNVTLGRTESQWKKKQTGIEKTHLLAFCLLSFQAHEISARILSGLAT